MSRHLRVWRLQADLSDRANGWEMRDTRSCLFFSSSIKHVTACCTSTCIAKQKQSSRRPPLACHFGGSVCECRAWPLWPLALPNKRWADRRPLANGKRPARLTFAPFTIRSVWAPLLSRARSCPRFPGDPIPSLGTRSGLVWFSLNIVVLRSASYLL